MPFDVQGAIAAGYSPAQVADEVGRVAGFDTTAARAHGYTDDAIIQELKNHSAPAGNSWIGDLKGGLHDLGTAASQGLKVAGGVMSRNGMPEYGGDVSSAGDFVQTHTPDAPLGDSPATQLGSAIRQGNYSSIPGLALHSALRAAPSVAPILGAAAVGGPVAAGAAAGALALGPASYGRAANNGRAEPTTGDVVGALPATAVDAVTGAYMPGGSAAKIASPVLRSAARTGIMAGTAGGMEAANEVGTTLGTDKGLSVDPAQIAGAAVTGGALGAAREVPVLGKEAVQAGSDRLMAKTLTPPTDVDAAASNHRSVGLMDAAKATTSSNQGKPLTDIQAANEAKSVLVTKIKDGILALRNEQMLTTAEGSSLLRSIQAEALRHNNSASPELFDRIDGLDSVPEEARKALRDQVMDLNTLSTQSFAKNTTGPLEKVGNVVGRVGGVAAGVASGSPLLLAESVLGYGVNAKIGGAIGRMGDTMLGRSQPTIRLQNINALKMLKDAGIDPASITPTPSVADILDGARTPPPTPLPPIGGMQGPVTHAPSVGVTLAKAQALDPTTGNAPGGYDPETGLPPDPVPVNTPLGRLRIDTPADVRMAVSQDASQPATAPVAPPAAHLPGTAYIASGDPRITPAVAVRAAQAAEAAGHVPPGTAASVASSTAPINPAIARMIQPHAQAMANDAFPLPEAAQTAAKRIYNPLSYRLAAEAYHAKAEAYATAHPAQANAVRHIAQIVDPAGKAAEAAKYPGAPFPEWLLNPGNRA